MKPGIFLTLFLIVLAFPVAKSDEISVQVWDNSECYGKPITYLAANGKCGSSSAGTFANIGLGVTCHDFGNTSSTWTWLLFENKECKGAPLLNISGVTKECTYIEPLGKYIKVKCGLHLSWEIVAAFLALIIITLFSL